MSDVHEFWNDLYSAREQLWSGNANVWLADLAADLTPGSALDLGCGEGGDSLWLAERGWSVLGLDVSTTALERAQRHVAAAGLADQVRWERHDLAVTFPQGLHDLVSAQFLQSSLEFPRASVLRRAAAAVAPGGRLLIVSHASMPSSAPDGHHHGDSEDHSQDHDRVHLPSAVEELDSLALDERLWTVEVCDQRDRRATLPDGQVVDALDNVIMVRRTD